MIFNIQSFSLQDGPGIRTTVFMKGCNLRCYWCHNPESWSPKPELMFFSNKCISCGACDGCCIHSQNGKSARFTDQCTGCDNCVSVCFAEAIQKVGYEINVDELVALLKKDRDVFEQSGGGVTFSGGEPLLQPNFLLASLKASTQAGIHTAMETAACVCWETIHKMLPFLNMVFCDIKTMDEQKHIQATGVSNKCILDNIQKMSENGVNLYLRTPVIPDFNDNLESMAAIADFVAGLPSRHPVELLAFQGLCVGKYQALNMEYAPKNLITPSKYRMKELAACFEKKDISVTYK